MSDVQATFLATLVDEWARGGVTDAVICPGNRSTLLSALLVADGRLRIHVMVDERSAAFFALGLGKATGRPAVFWCTSGTAAVEAHPAVVEASLAAVPLLVCTADRPPELHHVRDWQSIDQHGLFGASPRWSCDFGVATADSISSWRSLAARSVLETVRHPMGPGPVHMNIAIREPWTAVVGDLPAGRGENAPWHVLARGSRGVGADLVASVAGLSSRRGVIVAGGTELDADVVHACAAALGWPVLAEVRSGCRTLAPTSVGVGDDLARIASFTDEHEPEVVLRLGTPGLSKPLATWLHSLDGPDIAVGTHDHWVGATTDATMIIDADANAFCRQLADAVSQGTDPSWLAAWQDAAGAVEASLQSIFASDAAQLTEPAVAHWLVQDLPDGQVLFAATSMPVRDIEAFGPRRSGLRVMANRGASGMDGVVSTAAGVAAGLQVPVTLLIGDLTFLYDLNAQWVLEGAAGDIDLTMVVVDNGGGGIFSLLPQLEGIDSEVVEQVAGTPQHVNIPAVVRAFGVPCVEIESVADLRAAIAKPIGERRVLYVRSNRVDNAAEHARLHEVAHSALS